MSNSTNSEDRGGAPRAFVTVTLTLGDHQPARAGHWPAAGTGTLVIPAGRSGHVQLIGSGTALRRLAIAATEAADRAEYGPVD